MFKQRSDLLNSFHVCAQVHPIQVMPANQKSKDDVLDIGQASVPPNVPKVFADVAYNAHLAKKAVHTSPMSKCKTYLTSML